MTLVEPPEEIQAFGTFVSVAVDVAGAGGAGSFTYHVPTALGTLEAGEAVLVEFGRRQALAIVLGPADPPGMPTKPVVDRIRADGPLLPPLAMRLAAWIAGHYLAPPAIVLRAMLPPGMLERLELVAERRPAVPAQPDDIVGPTALPRPVLAEADLALLDALGEGPRPVRRIAAPEGRGALLRRLRALQAAELIDLDWTLVAAGAGPRYVRRVRLAPAPLAPGPAQEAAASRAGAVRLGPRQRGLLHELAVLADGVPAPELAARHGGSALASLVRRGLVVVDAVEVPRRPLGVRPPGARGSRPVGTGLTAEQLAATERIGAAILARDPQPFFLDGVTGSGKTAIYAEAIARSLAAGRRALVLVPEIALALPLVDRLRADLDVRVAIVHSGLGEGERADEWRRIRAGDVDVVVGTRLAILSPLDDVGIVIVDEEHDAAYKSDRTPRLQARDTAIQLGALAGAAVVLGSATPAVETEGRARSGQYRRLLLPARISGTPPLVEIVDLREELAAGHSGMLSRRLIAAIASLDPGAGDQAILVLNRRGSASVVLCRDCGHVQTCPECARPLVYHQAGITLRCHHCGRATPLAARCPACGSARIRYVGGGTERVEREVRDRFPELRVGRLDRDVVERKGAAARVVDAFSEGMLDVLVGTSLVTKGLDIPSVTVVGIVSADVALNLPDERAAERTYQLLVQAIGRAGRGGAPGRGIIQSYQPDHPAIVAAATGAAEGFFDAELALRRQFGAPPYGRVVKLTVAVADREAAEAQGVAMAADLRARSAARGIRAAISGPAPAFIARRADRWRYTVVVRGDDPTVLLDPRPGPDWSIDVDPESLL